MSKFCVNCGSQLEDGEKFCSSCGALVEEPVPSMQSANQQPTPEQGGSDRFNAAWQPEPEPDVSGGFSEQPVPEQSGFNQFNAAPQNDQSYPVNGAIPDTSASAVKKGSNKTIILAAAVGAVVIIAIIVAVILSKTVFGYQKIDASELFDVDFVGANGYGVCYVQLDIDPDFAEEEYGVYMEDYSVKYGLEDSDDVKYSDYFSDKSSKLSDAYNKASGKSEAKDMRDALLKVNKNSSEFKLTAEASEKEGLSNGDTITITVDFDEDYLLDEKIKLTNTEFEVTVEGLADAEVIDPFEDFDISFTGLDGYGEAEYSSSNEEHPEVEYYIYGNYDLSNGDTVEVEAYLDLYSYDYKETDTESGIIYTVDKSGSSVVYLWPYEDYTVTKEFTVEGLTGLTEVDPFEDVVLEYSGAAPFLEVDAYIPDDSPISDYVSVYIDGDYSAKYDIGDTVTVQIYAYSNSLASAGYKFSGTTDSDGYYVKDLTIGEDAPVYANATNAYSAEQALSDTFSNAETDIKQKLKDSYASSYVEIKTDAYSYDITSVDSVEVLDTYIAVNNATSYSNISWNEDITTLSRLYKVTVTIDNGDNTAQKSCYVVVSLSNVICCDGEYTVGEYDVSTDYYKTKDEALDKIEQEGFTVTTVTDSMTGGSSASSASGSTSSSADSSVDSKSDDSEEVVP